MLNVTSNLERNMFARTSFGFLYIHQPSSTHETKHSDFHVETLESCIAKELSDSGKRQNAGRMDRTNPEEIKWQECRQPLQCVG